MILTGLDLETTGLDYEKGHEIIEICLLHYDSATRQEVGGYTTRVYTERPIDADAQAVHGIANADLKGEPLWSLVAPKVIYQLKDTGSLVIHNADFDYPFLDHELKRAGFSAGLMLPTYCTLKNGRWACFDGKSPKLQELCFALGVPYDPALAHAARYDVERMMACYFKGVDRGFFHSLERQ